MDPCCPPGWGVLVAACTHGMGLGDPNPRWPRAIWARGVWPGVAAGCVGWRYGGAWLCAAPWPPFLPLPLLPPGLQLRARARGVKIVQQQPPAPARRGEGVCSSLHVPSTGTSQNSHGDRGAGALQPPQARGTGPAQLPAGPLGACSPRPPPALPTPGGRGCGCSPGPLFLGPAPQPEGSHLQPRPWDSAPHRPPRRSPAALSSLRSFLSITHPQRPSPSGGRGCRRGRELRGVPGSASSPRCWRGGRGSRRRRPQPSTSSPSPTSPPCFFPLVSSLAGFTWGTFLKC